MKKGLEVPILASENPKTGVYPPPPPLLTYRVTSTHTRDNVTFLSTDRPSNNTRPMNKLQKL